MTSCRSCRCSCGSRRWACRACRLALGLGPLNFLLAIASFGGAFVVTGLPDDSVTDVALQTLIAVPLATLFPVLFGGLGLVSSKLA